MSAKNSWKWNAFVEIGNTIHKMTAVLRTYKSKYDIMIVNGLIENNFISNLPINNQQLQDSFLPISQLTLTSCRGLIISKEKRNPDQIRLECQQQLTVCCYIKTRQYRPTQYNSKDYIKTDIMDKLYKGNVIVQNIRVGLASFYEWQTSNYTKRLDQSRDMAKLLDTMEADKDWAIFRASNCDRFIDQDNVPLVDPANIIYDGCDDLAIRVVRQGSLLRKEGGPFSPTGNKPDFSADSILEMPELTLDLAEYTLLPLNLGNKDPKDIVFVGKNSGMFGRDIKHKFKGKTMVESADWWTAINEHMKQMGTRTSVGTPTTQHSKPAFAGTAPLPKEGADGSTGLSQRAAASVATANAPSTSLQARLGAVVSHSKSNTIHATSGTRPVSMPAPPLPGRPKSTIVPTLRPKSESLIDESFDDLPSRRDSLSPPISFTTTSNDQIPTPAHVADFASFPPPDTSDKTEVGNVSALSLSEQMEMKLSHATSGGHSHDDPVELDTPSPKAKLASLSTGTSNPWDTFQDESGGW
ncbi:hypothetical protein BATDEDRAFT_28169 [Batrachochytrium dendrobatidis JAM81]|uniref:PH domain-containing protein n=1 Tax=Batrachochytrium dendrobatidis (strain JAM81 / FGSC 10211) TaxID=684364 RepID=F4PCW2_BATDJ|nr:uncharacterized protein BATDEDRAFT_28169 [Batrachochytrium dendrobatidis JAM81]EGF77042.1 hypothetical protein BATDEDRAFT_28169 [Batrachochytrium dendrobatidis JAM81]|eukprot:XP_006682428.1 hypothetical protein BATDEDRAFT_28169 [Batrachochytrium dendrobatidis JAM81]